MQRGRGGRDDIFGFGDPFAGFGGLGRPGSLISSFFGGRDPFDDPFFTQPFGSMMGPSMFGPSFFGPQRSMFGENNNAGFIEQAPQPSKSKGPVIKELSDEEGEEEENDKQQKENPRKHSRSGKEPYVQEPEEETEEKKSRHTQYRNDFSRAINAQPQNHSYSFHSSTVTYGGPGGAYYTSSTTRKTGGDGITVEESKEADTTTRRASHRISRGIRDKGHSMTRRLESDGRVDTMQMLHNLNEDELPGFNEAWKGSARQHFPGWNPGFDMLDNGNTRGGGTSGRDQQATRGWALPAAEQARHSGQVGSQPQPQLQPQPQPRNGSFRRRA